MQLRDHLPQPGQALRGGEGGQAGGRAGGVVQLTSDTHKRTALYCTILHCAVLHCNVPYCTALYCTVLHCAELHCTVLYCTALYCTVLYCSLPCLLVRTGLAGAEAEAEAEKAGADMHMHTAHTLLVLHACPGLYALAYEHAHLADTQMCMCT